MITTEILKHLCFEKNTNMRLFFNFSFKVFEGSGVRGEGNLLQKVPFAPKYIHKKYFQSKKLNNYILQKFVQIFAAKDNIQRYAVCVVFVG